MIKTEHPYIDEGSVASVVFRHEKPARIGLPRHRISAIGSDKDGQVYVFLGSKLQVSEFVETRREMRGQSGELPTSADIFRFGDKMLGDHLLEGIVEEKELDSLKNEIADGETLVMGPIIERTDPAEPPIIRRHFGGIYAPINVAGEQGWLIA